MGGWEGGRRRGRKTVGGLGGQHSDVELLGSLYIHCNEHSFYFLYESEGGGGEEREREREN